MKKYPRTFHFQFSPEVHDDDKVIHMRYLGNFLQDAVVITEKLDGGNTCLKGHQGVFARSHDLPAKEPWFDYLKGRYYALMDKLHPDLWIFGENMYAIHSIEYSALDDYFYVFAVYDAAQGQWYTWDAVEAEAKRLGFGTVPVLYRGTVESMAFVNRWMDREIKKPSRFGGDREGFVMRVAGGFHADAFAQHVAKYVRKGHVQTDERWERNWRAATLRR